jgi:SWI/SNF-related matrix-associated actin-dependent regulator 1 of chromatin subfamily A
MFVRSIHAAGVGLTLIAGSHVVYLELDWSPAIMNQAEDRCHRVGQTDSVQVQSHVFKDTIDE